MKVSYRQQGLDFLFSAPPKDFDLMTDEQFGKLLEGSHADRHIIID